MYWDFNHLSSLFKDIDKSKLLLDGNWGLEKECQRVTPSGDLALTAHPSVFGDKLKNPKITTDFSESQLELITPPFKSIEETYEYLKKIQVRVENTLDNELLWPLSMPPKLPEEDKIPIARFSNTPEGKEKEIYRTGLALRYGKKMQMISGIHYNFSFGDGMLDYLFEYLGEGKTRQAIIDEIYFSLSRNYLRYRWLLIYLFGASPSAHYTFYPVLGKELETVLKCCPECCNIIGRHEKYSTSLRVSRFGYSNSMPYKHITHYNNLQEYVDGLRKLLSARSKKFSKLGVFKDGQQLQLNDHILQKESEFYSSIRPKQVVHKGETQLEALESGGVKYLEVRIFDLDPFEKVSISIKQLYFLQVFMLFCLFEQSRPISYIELEKINKNHHLTALSGRKRNLKLYNYKNGQIPLKKWSIEIFQKLGTIAALMDQGTGSNIYQASIDNEFKKIMNPLLLPSSKIGNEMKENGEDYLTFGLRRAAKNKKSK